MNIAERLKRFDNISSDKKITLVAVSKTHPVAVLQKAYEAGVKNFGENRVQELLEKFDELPKDICWHMIGHLQRNKVKQIAAFIHLIHSVDSLRLLQEINKQGQSVGRVINCLLQVHIAKEDTKFGFSTEEVDDLLNLPELAQMHNIKICGLMGMATNTSNQAQVKLEFNQLKQLFERAKSYNTLSNVGLEILSMGMSSDYLLAIEEGSNMIRVGSALFGHR